MNCRRTLRLSVIIREISNDSEWGLIECVCKIAGCHVADLANEDTPQVYLACGRGPRSSVRVLRHGLEVSEMAVSELPGNPNAVWTVKKRSDG